MRKRQFFKFALAGSLILSMTSCAQDEGDDVRDLWWDGSAEFRDRQSIQQYESTVEVAIGDFVDRMSVTAQGASLLGRSSVDVCDPGGFEVWTASVAIESPTDPQVAWATADEVFSPFGLVETRASDDTRRWVDESNGGDVTVKVTNSGDVTISAVSGCRPSDGSTSPAADRVAPAWETALPVDPEYIQSGS